jgi:PAS domain S-box-containing protein
MKPEVTNNQYHIFDEFIEGVQILDNELRYIYINDAAEKQNKRPKNEFIGKKMVEVWPEITSTEAYKSIINCQENKRNSWLEFQSPTHSGVEGWFYLEIQPIQNGTLILSLDISERKRADQLILENEKLYHNLFDNLLNGFAYCKMLYKSGKPFDFIYLNVNKAFESLTGLHNVVGKKVSKVIPGIQRSDPQLIESYGRVASSGITETFETYLDSLKMWFFVTVYSSEKGFFIAIFDVITERKKAELKLKEQLNELQRWYIASIDREERIIALKQEVNDLLSQNHKPPRYENSGQST